MLMLLLVVEKISENVARIEKKCLCLQYKIEANHNKDYSVVKTFKTAEGKPFVFFFSHLQKTYFTFISLLFPQRKEKPVSILDTMKKSY